MVDLTSAFSRSQKFCFLRKQHAEILCFGSSLVTSQAVLIKLNSNAAGHCGELVSLCTICAYIHGWLFSMGAQIHGSMTVAYMYSRNWESLSPSLPCVREFNLYVYDTPIFFVTASVVDSGAHVRKETWFGTRLNVSIRRKATCAQKYCAPM